MFEFEEDDSIVDDAVYKHLGHGMCRGANWQGKKWPVLRGLRTLQVVFGDRKML